MGVSRHGEHLIKITRFGVVNSYLVREGDGFTAIDTGLPGSAKAIAAAADDAGGEIRRIALTHAHADHVGSLADLHRQLPGVEVLISARDARFLRGDRSLDPEEERRAKLKGTWKTVEVEPTRFVQSGDRVGSLEVVESPGHSPGHVSYLDTRDRSLIAGDAFQTLGGTAVAGKFQPRFPLVAMGTWHKPTSLESARQLRALDPSRLAVGHGRVIDSPGAEMDKAIAHAA